MSFEVLADKLSDTIADTIKRLFDAQEAKNNEKITQLQKDIADRDEKINDLSDQIAHLPVPEKGDPGEKGDSVTIDDIKPLVAQALDGISEQLDARISEEQVKSIIANIELPQVKDGKDALDLDILPHIDQDKSYPRNTYAKHEGGLWKSFQTTHGMRGWECIVEGIKSIQVDFDGERSVSIEVCKSGSDPVKQEYKMPVVIDRGVFKSDQPYEKSDGVTYGGSYWIAKQDAPSGSPGHSEDWRLSVKAGRNAKQPVKVS